MVSNIGQRADEGRVDLFDGLGDPRDHHVEDHWSRKPTSDLKVPETPTDIVRSYIYAVWQNYQEREG